MGMDDFMGTPFYESLNKADGNCSTFYEIKKGTVQGSILGAYLLAVYVSPTKGRCDYRMPSKLPFSQPLS